MDALTRIIAISTLALSGCTALETRESQAWLALHAVDTVQTYRVAHDPCFQETDGITRSLIGRRPSDAEVLAWSVGMAGLHLGVTELLLRNDHPKLARAWQYFRIGVTMDAISNNHSIGIRIGSPNHRPEGCGQPVAPQLPTPRPSRPIG